MTSAQMLARVRTLLDEASAGFYTDAEIYSALSDGQREVANFGLTSYRRLRENREGVEIPDMLKILIKTATGALSAGAYTVTLPTDYLEWIRTDLAHTAGSVDPYPCRYREYSLGKFGTDNTYFAENTGVQQHYFSINATQIEFYTPGAVSVGGSYTFVYFKIPTEIASGTEPVLPAFTHEAIVQYAYAFILGKDMRTQEATVEYQKFQDYLTRLV